MNNNQNQYCNWGDDDLGRTISTVDRFIKFDKRQNLNMLYIGKTIEYKH